MFRRRWLESGHSTSELKNTAYARLSAVRVLGRRSSYTTSFVLVIFDVEQRFALVTMLVFIVACYGAYFLQQWVRKRKKGDRGPTTSWYAFGSRARLNSPADHSVIHVTS